MTGARLIVATLALVMLLPCSRAEQRAVIDRLLELSRPGTDSSVLAAELRQVLTAEKIRSGTAWAGHGKDFIWAVEASSQPELFINDKRFAEMKRIGDTNLWYHSGVLPVGDAYKFHYKIDGKDFGGFLNVPAYTPESYAQQGVPEGKLSDKITHVSKIYEGMETNYWIYTPPQYDGKTALPLMIWQDGERLVGRNKEETCILCPSLVRILEVTENLTYQKKLTPMAHLFIQAGTLGGRSMRSIQYDSVTDRYARFLIEEILPEVYSKYNIRKDGYSHAMQGQSSGGICAFNAGWHRPDQFSRIASQHGTFTSVAFRNKEPEAAHVIPTWVRRQERKNLRVWISDGSEDYENEWGSWPLQNLQLANSLKFRGYDFRFLLGHGNHHAAIWAAKLPEALVWLWRDYDPSKQSQDFAQDASEKEKPFFRVRVYNR